MQVRNSTKFSGKKGKKMISVSYADTNCFTFKSKAAGLHLHHTRLPEGSTCLKVAERNPKSALHVPPMITQRTTLVTPIRLLNFISIISEGKHYVIWFFLLTKHMHKDSSHIKPPGAGNSVIFFPSNATYLISEKSPSKQASHPLNISLDIQWSSSSNINYFQKLSLNPCKEVDRLTVFFSYFPE